ncbi:uncharacterized protein LOC115918093 [Strongylocentrotus purpuratus]|uniref:CUB domain-containing protein n=1 Tax=Strongylocentrotus purpuratus TaxID=7668 RepID=A0A7M7NRJ5_STRPU|nr:uncharacterized protein LOC115918093 [Strongylocentrotus purpuratus]
MNFLTLGMKGYNNLPCKGIQGSKRFHSTCLLRSKVLNSEGLRQWYRESHIEGLQRSEIVHSAGPRKHDKSPYMSKSKAVNSAGEPKPDNFSSYRTEGLHRSKTWQDESLNRSQTLHSECLQTSDELYSNSCNNSTHPSFKGTRGINLVLQNALQALILLISMLLRLAGKYRHVVILIAFLTRAGCTDVHVPINCTSAAVMISPNYPSPYQEDDNKQWFVTAPEGKMILLTFNNFSLGSSGDVKVIEKGSDRKRQRYIGEENTFPPFLSRRNSLLLRFASDGSPTGNGFNISASCFELSGMDSRTMLIK